jgi:hypothetical protein
MIPARTDALDMLIELAVFEQGRLMGDLELFLCFAPPDVADPSVVKAARDRADRVKYALAWLDEQRRGEVKQAS